ncbi:restriction endonuclease [Bacteroides sp. AM07-16]|nr:restriction endonuclease [Bacteroides sp. AM07-16]
MKYKKYAHRYADIILNSEYTIKNEVDDILDRLTFENIELRFNEINQEKVNIGKKVQKGKQSAINYLLKEFFIEKGWEAEKKVFNDSDNDLVIDFWKNKIGIDVAFNHRSFIGGDLLRLQAGAEIKNMINFGIYVCGTKNFLRNVSNDHSSMVCFERVKWYLENFYSVLTVPILLVGFEE